MSRTNTTHLTAFTLSAPHSATMTFPSDDSNRIFIAVSHGSRWRMPLHWHPSKACRCISVKCLSRHLRVYRANDKGSGDWLGGPRTGAVMFEPGQRVTWGSARPSRDRKGCTEEWSVEFVVTDVGLHRNVSSCPVCRSSVGQTSWLILDEFPACECGSRPRYLPTTIQHSFLAKTRVHSATFLPAPSISSFTILSAMDPTADYSLCARLPRVPWPHQFHLALDNAANGRPATAVGSRYAVAVSVSHYKYCDGGVLLVWVFGTGHEGRVC